MAIHTITLNDSQEDALLALLDEHLSTNPESRRTLDEQLALVVTAALSPAEAHLAQLLAALETTGHLLPQHIRERMTEGLTPEQLERLPHIRPAQPRGLEREDAPSRRAGGG